MKISQNTPHYIQQPYANPANAAGAKDLKSQKNTGEDSRAPQSDSINLSGLTKDLQKVSKAMETEQAGRQKYVADIKQKVETNQYNINAEAVAGKLMNSYIDEIR